MTAPVTVTMPPTTTVARMNRDLPTSKVRNTE